MQTNYTNLQNQYNSLQSQYIGLQGLYNSLESQYNTLQSEYSSLQSQYSNVSGMLNAVITGMNGGSETDTVSPNSYDAPTQIYVPSGCVATATLTLSSTGPVNVYIIGMDDFISWAIDQYVTSIGQTPPLKWNYYYEFSGTYIQQTIKLSPPYPYGGDIYAVLVYNPNYYNVTVTASISLNHLSCGSSS
ncbi:hypothetical protein [Vulcanisaeta sp. JCM 16161]|uniref:hypothetical protein n=1 Tax=Vulcanisaeta sp. JCM 16161 TaxID=1295372 RepID=UPI000A4004C5|nr:hypothetical protein [Vulcanisaeta sp. JCM 16161]